MAAGLLSLPPEHTERLLAIYARAVARRRRQFYLVLAALAGMAALAAHYGEFDPGYFLAHVSAFTIYLGRILPQLSYAHFTSDIADWYWNLFSWLKLLADTVLIAYLATLLGSNRRAKHALIHPDRGAAARSCRRAAPPRDNA